MLLIFQKFEKKNKFYQKIAKAGVIKKIDHHSINSRNYVTPYRQALQEVPSGLMGREGGVSNSDVGGNSGVGQ